MTLAEILTIENRNQGEIHLFRQGMFYRVHERSCVAFQEIEPYQILKKRATSLGLDYIYSGFPSSVIDRIVADRPHSKEDDEHIVLLARCVSVEELDKIKALVPFSVGSQNPHPKRYFTPQGQTLPPIETAKPKTAKAAIEPETESSESSENLPNASQERRDNAYQTLIDLIRHFDTKNASPLGCQMFISMIQTQIN